MTPIGGQNRWVINRPKSLGNDIVSLFSLGQLQWLNTKQLEFYSGIFGSSGILTVIVVPFLGSL